MSDFAQMMAELQVEYLASMPQKLDEIEAHLRARNQALLRDDFHKFKGTGKTYGLPEISELCEVVEKICMGPVAAALTAVPIALKLLGQIHRSRLEKKPFEVSGLPDFLELKKILEKA